MKGGEVENMVLTCCRPPVIHTELNPGYTLGDTQLGGPPIHVCWVLFGGHVVFPASLHPTKSTVLSTDHFSVERSVFWPSPVPPTARITWSPVIFVTVTPRAPRACSIGKKKGKLEPISQGSGGGNVRGAGSGHQHPNTALSLLLLRRYWNASVLHGHVSLPPTANRNQPKLLWIGARPVVKLRSTTQK